MARSAALRDKINEAIKILNIDIDRSKVKNLTMRMPPDGCVTVEIEIYPDSDEISKLQDIMCAPVYTAIDCSQIAVQDEASGE